MSSRPITSGAALVLTGIAVWMSQPAAVSAQPQVGNTASYAPGSLGFYSQPAFGAFAPINGNPFWANQNNLYAPFYYPYPVYGLGYADPFYGTPATYNSSFFVNNINSPPYTSVYSPAVNDTGWGRSPLSGAVEFVPPRAADVATITVQVPAAADVWVEGVKTKQQGTSRVFVSPPLDPGRSYVYEIRAEWKSHGEDVSDTQHIAVQPGDRVSITFRPVAPLRGQPSGKKHSAQPERRLLRAFTPARRGSAAGRCRQFPPRRRHPP